MDEDVHEALMFFDRKRFGEEVSEVSLAGTPKYPKVANGYTISNPMIAHVDCFGLLELYCLGGYADGAVVVAEYVGFTLGVAESKCHDTEPSSTLAVDK